MAPCKFKRCFSCETEGRQCVLASLSFIFFTNKNTPPPSPKIKERKKKKKKQASLKADWVPLDTTVFLKERRDKILMSYFGWETSWTMGNVELKKIMNREQNWAQCRGKEAGTAGLSDVIYEGGRQFKVSCWIPREAGEEACNSGLQSLTSTLPATNLSLWHGCPQGGKWKYIATVSNFWVLIEAFSHLEVRDAFPINSA